MKKPCRYIFVEYGPMALDLNLRVRIDELENYLAAQVSHFTTLRSWLLQTLGG